MDCIQVRLDRAFITIEWMNHFCCKLLSMVCLGLDHSPISLTLETINRKKDFLFRFGKMWFAYSGLFDKIKEWWGIEVEGTTMYKVAKKLRFIKMEIQKQNKMEFCNIFQAKEGILEDLVEVQEEIQNWGYDDIRMNSKKDILAKVHNIRGKEKILWRHRSRSFWLKEGAKAQDSSTSPL